MRRSKGKRPPDSTSLEGDEQALPAVKRPSIGSLTSEVAAADSAISEGRCFCRNLHEVPNILRKLADQIDEAIEHPLEKFPCPDRSHPKVTKATDVSELELRIRTPLSLRIYTEDEVTGKDGKEILVALVDAKGEVVKSFPEVKLNVDVLHGDFNSGNDRTWSKEDFDGHIVKKRDNKALLVGHRQVTLKGGFAKVIGLKFADNSSFVRTNEFRLGVQVAPPDCEGRRIREAITGPFRVLDRRGKRNGKHDVPRFNDEIWRLRSLMLRAWKQLKISCDFWL
ncbi:Calmodulin-binding protein 60 C-like protein [Drosera capensis]